MPAHRRSLLITSLVVVVVLAVAVPAAIVVAGQRAEERTRREQRAAAEAFAAAWQGGRLAGLSFAGADGAQVASQVQTITAGMTPAATDAPSSVTVTGIERTTAENPPTALAHLSVTWHLPDDVAWTYPTTATLRQDHKRWLVEWAPAVVHPGLLTPGQVLRVQREQPARAEILGAGDQVLVTERPVVDIGIMPSRTTDPKATAEKVAAIVGVDAASLAKRVAAAKPDSFVDVITLRREVYDAMRDSLHPIPGTVFAERDMALAPSATFARALIGTVGPATKEIVDRSDGRVLPGDQTGLSGLQAAYDERLAGTPGITVIAAPAGAAPTTAGGTSTTTGTGGAADAAPGPGQEALFARPARPGQPLHLTLDRRIQEAADAALAGATKPSALVAVRVGTGEVLAVANGGADGAAGYDRALLGQYPPGSTFKVATTLALLKGGLSPNDAVNCPPTISVGGKSFKNAEGEVLGRVPFRMDFAHSCNTAFVGSSGLITSQELASSAQSLGVGAPDTLGVTAFMGDVPVTADRVQHAAQVIGQGKVLVSPLTEASMSAGVAAGRFVPPRLVTDPEPVTTADVGAPLPADAVRQLRAMMRLVVTSGTGTALDGVPGGPVAGKTGTAEFGSGDPPQTHAWFTGYQRDVAFAVVVERGGFGGKVAAPLAADFLRRLASVG